MTAWSRIARAKKRAALRAKEKPVLIVPRIPRDQITLALAKKIKAEVDAEEAAKNARLAAP